MSHEAVITLLLPQAGNSMEEGTIVTWRVKPGDRIRPGDVLYELETDKATIEVESEVEGRVSAIVVGDGQTAPVKTAVAYLSEDDAAVKALLAGSAPAPTPAKAEAPDPALSLSLVPVATEVPQGKPTDASRKRVSPVARRAAADLGVDVEGLGEGSGPDGRILLEDVRAAVAARPAPSAPAPAAAADAPVRKGKAGRRPMSKMRRAIARNLTMSKQTVPHWYIKMTIDAAPVIAYRHRQKALFQCSMNDVLVEACVRAIVEFPQFRTQVDGDDLVTQERVHIGLAVAVEDGLVVPVIKNADTLSLSGIAVESRRIIESARQGKPENMGQGVFTISNLGMFGVDEFTAIVNPPEAAILAVGSVREQVIVENGAMRPGKTLTLTLSSDHRVIDGAVGARFMARLREILAGL